MQMTVQALASLGSTPDQLGLTASPAVVALLPASLMIHMKLKAAVAAVTVRPYYWDNVAAAWIGVGTDGTNPIAAAVVDPAKNNACADSYWTISGAGQYWMLVAESGVAANVTYAALEAIPNHMA